MRADWEDIGLGDLKTSYGFGFRAGTEDRIFVRIDIGTGGGEGTRVFLKFGPVVLTGPIRSVQPIPEPCIPESPEQKGRDSECCPVPLASAVSVR